MIGFSRQAEAALREQVAAIDARLIALMVQLTEQQERAAQEAVTTTQLEHKMIELELQVAAQARKLEAHLAITQGLLEDRERQDEDMRQVRADLMRMERQAAIDLDETRQTNAAIATSVLKRALHQ